MIDFLNHTGFLRTHATNLSDFTLVLTIITAILFTIGWLLVRRKHYEAHRWVQTVAAVINALVVLSVMISSFIIHILPGIPGKLLEGSYGITTVHAFVGTLGLLLGIFVVLRGNGLVPVALRFTNYKLFMRAAYTMYMLATFLGVMVYIEAFIIGI
jgi:uncharacterized membrane protein YozB (DUF420 family)